MRISSTARTFLACASGILCGLLVPGGAWRLADGSPDPAHALSSSPETRIATLQAELDSVRAQLQDQSHAMVDVGHHFTNLWLAAQKKNWRLAEFFLDETRSHLAWAVRLKPIRKDSLGHDINLPGILEAVDNTFLAELKKDVQANDSAKFATDYRRTLEGCYGCHKTSEKPYLRPQVPDGAGAQILNFDPDASWPQ